MEFCEFHYFLFRDCSSGCTVDFISDNYNQSVFLGKLFQLLNPLFDLFKRITRCYVINNESSFSISVVNRDKCTILLLPCCIPNWKKSFLIIRKGDLLFQATRIGGGRRLWVKFILDETNCNRCLSDPCYLIIRSNYLIRLWQLCRHSFSSPLYFCSFVIIINF